MGYTTYFDGEFELDKPLTQKQGDYLRQFNSIRHMMRDAVEAGKSPDLIREAVGLPIGVQGCYFVGEGGVYGQCDYPFNKKPNGIQNYNRPPQGQPGLWCQWTVSPDNKFIEWDEGEKFYCYSEWLDYIIQNFLKPWGRKLNGEVTWRGEGEGDIGIIIVEDNVMSTKLGRIVYE